MDAEYFNKPLYQLRTFEYDFEIDCENGEYEDDDIELDFIRGVFASMRLTTKSKNQKNKMFLELEFRDDIVLYESIHVILISKNSGALHFNLQKSATNPLIYESEKNIPDKLNRCASIHSEYCGCDDCESPETRTYYFEKKLIFYNFESSHIKKLSDSLESALKCDEYSDLTIIVNGIVFNVRKLIISSKSSVFKKMIDTDMIEKQSNCIDLKDTVNTDTFENILRFIYLGTCNLSNDNVHEIFCFSHQYEIDELQELCKKYMLKNISKLDKVETFKLISIDNYNLSEVRILFKNFILLNKENIVNDKKFLNYLVNNLNADNVYFSYDLAMKFELDIINNIKDFIMKNLEKVMNCKNFVELIKIHPEYMIDILKKMTKKDINSK